MGLFAGWGAALVSVLILSLESTPVKNSADIRVSTENSNHQYVK